MHIFDIFGEIILDTKNKINNLTKYTVRSNRLFLIIIMISTGLFYVQGKQIEELEKELKMIKSKGE